MFRATVTTATLLLALPLGLSACGGDEPSEKPLAVETARNGDVFNTADADFATAMIPLHAEALAMVDLTFDKDLSPEVQAVADDLQLTATPEVEEMTSWLTSWDQPVPETVRDHVNAGHSGAGGMDQEHGHGSAELDRLAAAEGADFEALFVELMLENHEEAVELAEDEVEDGTFRPALDLARSIRTAHGSRIETLEARR